MGPRLLGGLKCGKHISIGLSIQLKLLQLLTELPLAQRQFNIGKVFHGCLDVFCWFYAVQLL